MLNDPELIKDLELLEKKGFDRRKFLKIMASAGVLSLIGSSNTKAFASSSKAKGKIVIVGGGAAGLSMAARLVKWLDDPDITLIDPSDRQFYQPGFTLIASGVYKPDEVWKKQEDCIPEGVKWIKDSVVSVNPEKNTVRTAGNGNVNYDFLVMVPGIKLRWERVEGIDYNNLGAGNAHCIYDFNGAQKTWTAMQEFAQKGGHGIFTDTYTKHKCGGAPKKICLLTEHRSRMNEAREKLSFQYYTASKQLYDVPFFTPRLEEIFRERNVPVQTRTRITGVDTQAKKAYLEKREMIGDKEIVTPFTEDYDFLHFLPPMTTPDFVKEAGLGYPDGKYAADGWIMVDKETLIHKKYPNIVSLGDAAGIPTSKTSAAVRMQVPVAARNLISLMEGKEPQVKYNGYAACPIITDYGHVLLAEFDYNKKECITFPFSLLDMSKEQAAAWFLKVYILKPLYFYGMLNGLA